MLVTCYDHVTICSNKYLLLKVVLFLPVHTKEIKYNSTQNVNNTQQIIRNSIFETTHQSMKVVKFIQSLCNQLIPNCNCMEIP